MEGQETIKKLEELADHYPNNEEIVLEYARGLVNLVAKQEVMEGQETIRKLERLVNQYPGNEEIKQVYQYALQIFSEIDDKK